MGRLSTHPYNQITNSIYCHKYILHHFVQILNAQWLLPLPMIGKSPVWSFIWLYIVAVSRYLYLTTLISIYSSIVHHVD